MKWEFIFSLAIVFIICLFIRGSGQNLNLNLNFGGETELPRNGLIMITDDNWEQILTGEWMIAFTAPFSAECRGLQPVWEEFATWSMDLEINVGQVDITNSPGLSGRFMITSFPTIYHAKDGAFRQYTNPKAKDDFLTFVEEKKWAKVQTISWWRSPTSIHMTLTSIAARALKVLLNGVAKQFGLPLWCAYSVLGGIILLMALFVGLASCSGEQLVLNSLYRLKGIREVRRSSKKKSRNNYSGKKCSKSHET